MKNLHCADAVEKKGLGGNGQAAELYLNMRMDIQASASQLLCRTTSS